MAQRMCPYYVHFEPVYDDAQSIESLKRRFNYETRGKENRKTGSIRRHNRALNKGLGDDIDYSRYDSELRGWVRVFENFRKSRDSRGNKRKKTVKFGAVDSKAKILGYIGEISVGRELTDVEFILLKFRLHHLTPDDCPFRIVPHYGRNGDHKHFHIEYSERHDFGYGKKDEATFGTVRDAKSGKLKSRFKDLVDEEIEKFYRECGIIPIRQDTKESYMRHIERYEEKLIELENDSSRNKPTRKISEFFYENKIDFYKNKIEEYEEKYVQKKVEEFDREVEEFEKYKELEISGSVRSCREKYKDQVEDSIDKEEEISYVVDDKIKDKEDDKDTFEFKADVVLEAATNKDFEADVVFNKHLMSSQVCLEQTSHSLDDSAIDKITCTSSDSLAENLLVHGSTYDKNEILYEESIKREEDEIERNAYIENNKLLHSNDEYQVERLAGVSARASQRVNSKNKGMKAARVDKNSEQFRKFQEAARRLKENNKDAHSFTRSFEKERIMNDALEQVQQSKEYLKKQIDMFETSIDPVSKPGPKFKR